MQHDEAEAGLPEQGKARVAQRVDGDAGPIDAGSPQYVPKGMVDGAFGQPHSLAIEKKGAVRRRFGAMLQVLVERILTRVGEQDGPALPPPPHQRNRPFFTIVIVEVEGDQLRKRTSAREKELKDRVVAVGKTGGLRGLQDARRLKIGRAHV